MGLCLLVYTLGQRQLRQALAHSEETIPSQLQKPTLRWVFQCFQAVHLVRLNHQLQISNLTDARLKILRLLGNPCQKYYLICWLTCEMSDVGSIRELTLHSVQQKIIPMHLFCLCEFLEYWQQIHHQQ